MQGQGLDQSNPSPSFVNPSGGTSGWLDNGNLGHPYGQYPLRPSLLGRMKAGMRGPLCQMFWMFSDVSGLCNVTTWHPTSTISSPLLSSPPAHKQCKGKASVRVTPLPPFQTPVAALAGGSTTAASVAPDAAASLEPPPAFKMAQELTFTMLVHAPKLKRDGPNSYVTVLLTFLQTVL